MTAPNGSSARPTIRQANCSCTPLEECRDRAVDGSRRSHRRRQASALTWHESIGTGTTVATFDRRLWDAGKKATIRIWPETLKERVGRPAQRLPILEIETWEEILSLALKLDADSREFVGGNGDSGCPTLISLTFDPHGVGTCAPPRELEGGVADTLAVDENGSPTRFRLDNERTGEFRVLSWRGA
jgi:hypothetical protein